VYRLDAAVRRHVEAVLEVGERFFGAEAARLASTCWGMARRFHRGGKLLVQAPAGPAFTDAQHNAVEFIHPVLVGKRALPAVAVRDRAQLDLLQDLDDIRMEVAPPRLLVDEEELRVATDDPLVAQEVLETAYHELWELVRVFFEHEGLLRDGGERQACLTCGDVAVPASVVSAVGAAGLVRTAAGEEECDLSLVAPVEPGEVVLVHGGVALQRVTPIDQFSREFYPFLDSQPVDVPRVLADVAASVRAKWAEVAGLRRAIDLGAVEAAAGTLVSRARAGGRVLALGNGGSATDSADLAADLLAVGVPAVDLAGEPAVVTAIANDVGFDEVFARQIIALGRPGDVVVGISTSGRSRNAGRAFEQARTQGLATIGLAGYGGGDWRGALFLDHLLVTNSTYVPRIQEVQATVYHSLVRALEAALGAEP
jgi:D-sedoheptulose 7-phosphate isomerase